MTLLKAQRAMGYFFALSLTLACFVSFVQLVATGFNFQEIIISQCDDVYMWLVFTFATFAIDICIISIIGDLEYEIKNNQNNNK